MRRTRHERRQAVREWREVELKERLLSTKPELFVFKIDT